MRMTWTRLRRCATFSRPEAGSLETLVSQSLVIAPGVGMLDSVEPASSPLSSLRLISSATLLKSPIAFITSLLSRQPGPDLFLDRQPAHSRLAPVVSEQRVEAGTTLFEGVDAEKPLERAALRFGVGDGPATLDEVGHACSMIRNLRRLPAATRPRRVRRTSRVFFFSLRRGSRFFTVSGLES